jgi:predicted esterase
MSQAHKLTIPRTAHYYTIGKPSKKTRRFWMVCHGYGQLARTFIRRFKCLDDGETLVLAPEGLSLFYWEGYTGEPVASWMTKEHRLDEIADYANYLQTLYDLYLPQLAEDVQIILFGFSQGTATQCRWVMRNLPHFDHLVLWAGQLPEDLDYASQTGFFSKRKLHFVYGTADPFLTEERLAWQQNFAVEQHLPLDVMVFDGKHEVEKKALQKLNARILTGG